MKSKWNQFAVMLVAAACLSSGPASAAALLSGQGSCQNVPSLGDLSCANTSITAGAQDTSAGNLDLREEADADPLLAIARNWFAFTIDSLLAATNSTSAIRSSHFKGATLSIFNPLGNTITGADFSVYAYTGTLIGGTDIDPLAIFPGSGLASELGSPYKSKPVAVGADGYVTYELNEQALDDIWDASFANGLSPFTFIFVGEADGLPLPPYDPLNLPTEQALTFSYSNSNFKAAKLDLLVPEPGSVALFGIALLGLVGVRRKAALN